MQLFDLISAGPLIAPDWVKTGLFMEKIHSLHAESRDDVVCNFTSILVQTTAEQYPPYPFLLLLYKVTTN